MSDDTKKPLADALVRLAKAAYEQGYKHGLAAAVAGSETDREAQK